MSRAKVQALFIFCELNRTAVTVSITAQFIAGDPLFEQAQFYSFSERAGASVLFMLQQGVSVVP